MIHSNYLNKDFDFNDINHDTLKRIIHNENIGYEYKVKEINDHPVVICTMFDEKGRKVQAIGEATIESLVEDFEKTYPTIVASNRAFDSAATMYLDLLNEEKVDAISYSEENNKTEINVSAAPINMKEEVVSEENHEENISVPVAEEISVPDCLITIGKYKNKTIKASEVVATDRPWAEYIVSKMTNVNGSLLEQVNSLRYFLNKE